MKKENLPPETILSSARQAVDSFLTTIKMAFIKPAEDLPPRPRLEKLKENEVPTLSENEFDQGLRSEEQRRKLILGLINNGAWQWPENKKTYG